MRHLAPLFLLLLICGCKTLYTKSKPPDNSDNSLATSSLDQREVSIVVCEYIVTNAIVSPSTARMYVALDDQQVCLLKARVPHFDVRNVSLDSRNTFRKGSHYIKVTQVRVDGASANAEAIWTIDHSFWVYEFDLAKVSGWLIKNAVETRSSIAD